MVTLEAGMTSPRCPPAAFAFGTLSSAFRNVSSYPVPCSCQYTECMTGTAHCECGVSNGRELAPTCATNLLSALKLLHLSAMKLLQEASDFCANTLEVFRLRLLLNRKSNTTTRLPECEETAPHVLKQMNLSSGRQKLKDEC